MKSSGIETGPQLGERRSEPANRIRGLTESPPADNLNPGGTRSDSRRHPMEPIFDPSEAEVRKRSQAAQNSDEPIDTSADAEAAAKKSRARATIDKIKNLPTPVGVILIGAGMAGLVLPGPFGTPLLFAGGLVLAPKTFSKLDKVLGEKFPKLRQTGLDVVERFLSDMEKRFPDGKE